MSTSALMRSIPRHGAERLARKVDTRPIAGRPARAIAALVSLLVGACASTSEFVEAPQRAEVDASAVGGSDAGSPCGNEGDACCSDGTCDDVDGDQKLVCSHGQCRSREWALWPIPSPPGTKLPHPAHYSVLGPIVHDEVTNLEWQREPSLAILDWEGARAHCRALRLGERSFRLPTRIELASLTQFTRAEPAYDDGAFSKFSYDLGYYYWTSSSSDVDNEAFQVEMAAGSSMPRSKDSSGRAWCVARTAPDDSAPAAIPAERFVVEPATIRDSTTGLVWERFSPQTKMTWAEATTYCGDLALGDGGFRLPAPTELLSIMDPERRAPGFDTSVFSDVGPIDTYWGLPPSAMAPIAVWMGYAQWGSTKATANPSVSGARARCVASPSAVR